MFVQGAGALDLLSAARAARAYVPHVSVWPDAVDATEDPCEYAWPFCAQPIYFGSEPLVVNTTILNGAGAHGIIASPPKWIPDDPAHAQVVQVSCDASDIVWPYHGYLAATVTVSSSGRHFSGVVRGRVEVRVRTSSTGRVYAASFVLTLRVVLTPPRSSRLLWDNYHNIMYPFEYVPRDDLSDKDNVLDLHGDHPHTNFRLLFTRFRARGYYIDVLSRPYTSVDASQYAALLVVDPEAAYSDAEAVKLANDIEKGGLGLVILADWYSIPLMSKARFFDVSTKRWRSPITGGANVPALNALLGQWNASFSETTVVTSIKGSTSLRVASGTTVASMPAGASLAWAKKPRMRSRGI